MNLFSPRNAKSSPFTHPADWYQSNVSSHFLHSSSFLLSQLDHSLQQYAMDAYLYWLSCLYLILWFVSIIVNGIIVSRFMCNLFLRCGEILSNHYCPVHWHLRHFWVRSWLAQCSFIYQMPLLPIVKQMFRILISSCLSTNHKRSRSLWFKRRPFWMPRISLWFGYVLNYSMQLW